MARERETTRSRERTTGKDRDRGSKKGGSGKKIAINLDPKSYEQYGLWGDGEDVLIQDVWAAPFNYGGKMRDDGKPQTTLAIFTEYLDEATGDIHIEPISYGDLRHYAPGNSPEEFDYAGGDDTTWAKIANGEETITDEMRGPYILPVPQSYDGDDPVYRRLTGTRGSNGDFYIQQAIECGKSAGIKIAFDPDDPNLRNLLRGVRGRIAKLGNTLRKGGGGEGFGGDKSKPLVLEEIYERIDLDKSDKAGSGSRKRTANDDDDADEKPVTRRGRAAAEPGKEDEEEEAPATRGRRGIIRKASEPTPEFLSDFENRVESFLSTLSKKSCKRTHMNDIYTEYEVDTPEERWALEVLTDEKYIDTFWKREKGEGNFDYNEETDTASL